MYSCRRFCGKGCSLIFHETTGHAPGLGQRAGLAPASAPYPCQPRGSLQAFNRQAGAGCGEAVGHGGKNPVRLDDHAQNYL